MPGFTSSNPFNNFAAGGPAGYRQNFAIGVGQRENHKYLNSPISHANMASGIDKSPRGNGNPSDNQVYNPMINAPMSISGNPNQGVMGNPFG